MKNILIVHQSSELYGSDKTLLLFLKKLDQKKYNPIIILPSNGPLKTELEKINLTVYIKPVLKLYRDLFKIKNLLTFISDFFIAIHFFRKLDKQHHFDYVYSNTLAVLAGFSYSFLFKKRHIWHVHEIIENPKIINKIYNKLLQSKVNDKVIFNSIQTQIFWSTEAYLIKNGVVIWNGLDFEEIIPPTQEEIKLFRKNINANNDDIVICIVGRFNPQKGQLLLLEAFNKLNINNFNIKLLLVGSYLDNQQNYYEQLLRFIQENKLSEKVTFIPFQKNIWNIWYAVDIVTVPSLCLESFGLVAIEAMYANKPVIVSAHGGLINIVDDNINGLLTKPFDIDDLANNLQRLIDDSHLRAKLAKNGKESVLRKFTIEAHMTDFYKILK